MTVEELAAILANASGAQKLLIKEAIAPETKYTRLSKELEDIKARLERAYQLAVNKLNDQSNRLMNSNYSQETPTWEELLAAINGG